MSMQVRLKDDEDAMLEFLASQEGTSKNQVLAALVRKEFQRITTRSYTHDVLGALTRERADLLDRLTK